MHFGTDIVLLVSVRWRGGETARPIERALGIREDVSVR